MDTESLRTLLRALVFAAPLAVPLTACAGSPPPSRPVVHLDPPPPAPDPETEREEPPPPETHTRNDGTMDPDEFDRQWRESLEGDGPQPAPIDMIMEGRPLMAEGGPVRASLRVVEGNAPVLASQPEAAARWLDTALAEHASVASFARAVMELSALGAPTALLEGHLKAGLDEVRHTELAFEMAGRFGAPHRVPGPLPVPPPRAASLARLVVDTFLEGCVNETLAALMAARAAAHCEDAVVRAALETLAEDEARHAALAWQTVRWALESDPSVRPQLASVALPAVPEGGAHQPGLLACGVLDAAETNRAARDALARVVVPMRDELLER